MSLIEKNCYTFTLSTSHTDQIIECPSAHFDIKVREILAKFPNPSGLLRFLIVRSGCLACPRGPEGEHVIFEGSCCKVSDLTRSDLQTVYEAAT